MSVVTSITLTFNVSSSMKSNPSSSKYPSLLWSLSLMVWKQVNIMRHIAGYGGHHYCHLHHTAILTINSDCTQLL